jgi:hypothetical protein
MPALQPLYGNDPIEAPVAGLPYFTHTARSDQREDFVRAEFVAWMERHLLDAVNFSSGRSAKSSLIIFMSRQSRNVPLLAK